MSASIANESLLLVQLAWISTSQPAFIYKYCLFVNSYTGVSWIKFNPFRWSLLPLGLSHIE